MFVSAHGSNLEDSLAESGLDGETLEILGVGVVVECEVGLHDAQFVMLERRSQSLLTSGRTTQ